MRPPSSSSGSNPISTADSEDAIAVVAVTWTWWEARSPARPLPPSATGMVVVNGRAAGQEARHLAGLPMVTVRTVPAPTSAVNWV